MRHADVVAAERARVATEGWGARLLALQGEDGQWEGGALFPARKGESADGDPSDQNEGQPWTATEPTLTLLQPVRGRPGLRTGATRPWRRSADHCRWEYDGEPFFDGEVEPCINGKTVALGAYFGQDVDGIVARLLGEQLDGRRVELRGGERVRSLVVRHHDQRPGRAAGARAGNRWLGGIHRGETPGRGVPPRTKAVPAQEHRRRRQPGLAAILISDPLALRRAACPGVLPGSRRSAGPAGGRSDSAAPVQAAARWHAGCWRTRIPAKSISCSKTATVGPAGGTRYGRCASSTGTGPQPTDRRPARAACSPGLGGGRESGGGEVVGHQLGAASADLPARGRGRPGPHEASRRGFWQSPGGLGLRVRNGSSTPQQNIVGAAIWPSSSSVMMLSGRGRRKPSIACMSEATVRAFPGRRAARRSTSTRSSGAAAAAAGLSLAEQPPGTPALAWERAARPPRGSGR